MTHLLFWGPLGTRHSSQDTGVMAPYQGRSGWSPLPEAPMWPQWGKYCRQGLRLPHGPQVWIRDWGAQDEEGLQDGRLGSHSEYILSSQPRACGKAPAPWGKRSEHAVRALGCSPPWVSCLVTIVHESGSPGSLPTVLSSPLVAEPTSVHASCQPCFWPLESLAG